MHPPTKTFLLELAAQYDALASAAGESRSAVDAEITQPTRTTLRR
jgi:hypothetical protein